MKPANYVLVILYLTYFYKNECGNITLKSDEIIDSGLETKTSLKLHSGNADDEDIYDIIQTILDKGILPKESTAAYRTHVYFHVFIISDAAWILSAFLLFAGTCFQIKKYLSLLFYCPWLIVTAWVILLDVVSSVHFGLDILKIQNVTTWLKFIGVQNYQDFTELDHHNLSYIIPLIPVLSLCILFSRALVLWIWNIVMFVQVLNTAVLAFQGYLDGNNPKGGGVFNRARNKVGDLNLDSSASRIRNWQLFYGAIESSTSSNSSKSSERNCNSNNTMRRTSTKVKITDTKMDSSPPLTPDSGDSYNTYVMSLRTESKMQSNISTYYHGYTDVAESFDHTLGKGVEPAVVNHIMNHQLPWSYFKPLDEKYNTEDNDSGDLDFNCYRVSVEPFARCNPRKLSTDL